MPTTQLMKRFISSNTSDFESESEIEMGEKPGYSVENPAFGKRLTYATATGSNINSTNK